MAETGIQCNKSSTSEPSSGLVAIVGRPNVGKSTLLNQLTGARVSIVSRKAQTTRYRINAILTTDKAQFVFVDTPGWQTRRKSALDQAMNHGVISAMAEVDVVILVVEAGIWTDADCTVLKMVPTKTPLILAINKIDKIRDKSELYGYNAKIEAGKGSASFVATVPLSAIGNRQLDILLAEVQKHLPNKGLLYESDQLTDRNELFMAAEYVREKIFRLLGDELPYGMTVEIEKFEQEGDLRRIFAVVLVDRARHKAMLIGKKGQRLKRVASEARQDMQKMFGGTVYLEVWVKVKSGWQHDENLLKQLGYA